MHVYRSMSIWSGFWTHGCGSCALNNIQSNWKLSQIFIQFIIAIGHAATEASLTARLGDATPAGFRRPGSSATHPGRAHRARFKTWLAGERQKCILSHHPSRIHAVHFNCDHSDERIHTPIQSYGFIHSSRQNNDASHRSISPLSQQVPVIEKTAFSHRSVSHIRIPSLTSPPVVSGCALVSGSPRRIWQEACVGKQLKGGRCSALEEFYDFH